MTNAARSREAPVEESPRVPDLLPVLPLKDAVLYPFIIVPLSVGRDSAIRAVDEALSEDRILALVAQRDPEVDEPDASELYEMGTAVAIMRMLKLPDGRIRILAQGIARIRIENYSDDGECPRARVVTVPEAPPPQPTMEVQALVRSAKEAMDRIVGLGKGVSPEVLVLIANLEDAGRLADLIASNLELTVDDAQRILETIDPLERLRRVSEHMHREIQLLTMQQEISTQARGEMDRSQREYFLRQQLRAIQLELGESDDLAEEIAVYRRAVEERGLSEEAKAEVERQIQRLERSHPDSAESSVQRTYLDWLTGLPWNVSSEDQLDLEHAREVLDADHYDLEKVKERILEYLAVRKLKGDARGPILCFVGPPGVGKTSLGRSIAQALGRKFARLSLGGVRDEAEIRGHRRTYVGAMPGRILQGIHQAGTSNPVFMLDEIDKLGSDFRGDPSSALLEVLDPEQNSTFRDHYLGVAYDLSRVLWITTANWLDPIQPAFLDRMEVIRLSGYTLEEKVAIARRHLIPKQLAENGITADRLSFGDKALRRLVDEWTREAGLRNLEREIASVCRKVAVQVAGGATRKITVGPRKLESLLGQPRFLPDDLLGRDRVGVTTGLAWTAFGGEIIFVEAAATPGKGVLAVTGQLGEVMKESAQAAWTYCRTWAARHGHPVDFFTQHDVHVHLPAGAIPKDGPSAGITMATSILSRSPDEGGSPVGDDRRDHPARRHSAGGRPQGEVAGRARGGSAHGAPAQAQSPRPGRASRRGQGRPRAGPGRADGGSRRAGAASELAVPRRTRRRAGRQASVSGGEEAFVAWLQRRLPGGSPIGDDTAALKPPRADSRWVVTVDQQIEGTHFAPGLEPRTIGQRLVRVNLSDLAASGARPRWALLAVAVPPELGPRTLVEGVIADCKRFELLLVGGDVAHAPLLTASLTALGEKAKGDATLSRDRGRAGQVLWIGGTVGESALGCELLLRGGRLEGRSVRLPKSPEDPGLEDKLLPAARRAVLRNALPTPQLELGRWLAKRGARRSGACIDVSDGLAKDLRRICTASGVGVELDLRLLKKATSARFEELAGALGLDPIAVALAGGEDYVLLFTLPAGVEPPSRFRALPVGKLTRARDLLMLDRDGDRHELPHVGWDHLDE